jgi:hypothetical protein
MSRLFNPKSKYLKILVQMSKTFLQYLAKRNCQNLAVVKVIDLGGMIMSVITILLLLLLY